MSARHQVRGGNEVCTSGVTSISESIVSVVSGKGDSLISGPMFLPVKGMKCFECLGLVKTVVFL